MGASPSLCIVVPVFNEDRVIERNLGVILRCARGLGIKALLLAVNDGSSDDTKECLRRFSEGCSPEHFQYIDLPVNKGYGAACRAGLSQAVTDGFDYVLFMDSDLTDDPEYLTVFVEKMREGYDYIKTTRRAGHGGYVGVPLHRRVISHLGCSIARVATGLPLTDMANGFRAVKVDVLRGLDLEENGFGLIMEELMKSRLRARRYCEISRVQGIRSADARPSAFEYDFKTIWSYFKFLFV